MTEHSTRTPRTRDTSASDEGECPDESRTDHSAPPSWPVGNVTITRIDESVVSLPMNQLIPDAGRDGVDLHRAAVPAQHIGLDDSMRLQIAGFLIESRGRKILVDTCAGPNHVHGFPEASGRFLGNLARAGCTPDAVDAVICTHVHFDHVGWNTMVERGVRRPTFPEARYIVSGDEWDAIRDGVPNDLSYASVETEVKFLADIGMLDLVPSCFRLSEEISLMPTPGHSSGHVAVAIRSDDQHAVITGDAVHHSMQLVAPSWSSVIDEDPAVAALSRTRLAALAHELDVLVLGTHFPTPTAGRLRAIDGIITFMPAE